MNARKEKAAEYFTTFNCAQSVIAAFSDDFEVDEKTLLKIAGGFGAGFGGQQKTCGAVTGAMMVLGLRYGKAVPEDDAAKEKAYSTVKEFCSRFEKEVGSTCCKVILDVNLSEEAGQKEFVEKDLKQKSCLPAVHRAIEIVSEMI